MDELSFEWDENKNDINKQKHGISFETASEVFYDDNAIGSTFSSKLCIVSHCYRDSDNIIRLISAREATKKEKAIYQRGW